MSSHLQSSIYGAFQMTHVININILTKYCILSYLENHIYTQKTLLQSQMNILYFQTQSAMFPCFVNSIPNIATTIHCCSFQMFNIFFAKKVPLARKFIFRSPQVFADIALMAVISTVTSLKLKSLFKLGISMRNVEAGLSLCHQTHEVTFLIRKPGKNESYSLLETGLMYYSCKNKDLY